MAVSLYSLGAAQEVTGSKHIFEIDGRSFMIDCGAFQGKRAEADEKNRTFHIPVDKIESVILTHAHYDHVGLLPLLIEKGYRGNVYATPATRDLADLIMMDSARIQARDAEYLRKQATKKGGNFSWRPMFDEKDCTKATNQIVTLSYNRKMYIAPDVELEYFDAGHILGSAFACITIKGQRDENGNPLKKVSEEKISIWNKLFGWKKDEKRKSSNPDKNSQNADSGGKDELRILFTGDLGRKLKPIIRDPATNVPAPDYIVIESTYGNRKHEDAVLAMDELRKIVIRAVEKKGKIIIPAFAIERTQEIVYYLHLLVDQKKIPKIPIYVDSPMAVNATSIFQIHQECYSDDVHEAFLQHHKNPFGFGSLNFVNSVEESKALNKKEGPMIIVSADGMCECGRVVHHLANNISDPRNTILIVGYMAENTLGRKIRDHAEKVKIFGDEYEVKADVECINAFSAHADYTEMTKWLKTIDTSRLKKIFMVHGEKSAQEFFQNYLKENGFPDVQIVKYGETYELE